jgi:hypothetical protein
MTRCPPLSRLPAGNSAYVRYRTGRRMAGRILDGARRRFTALCQRPPTDCLARPRPSTATSSSQWPRTPWLRRAVAYYFLLGASTPFAAFATEPVAANDAKVVEPVANRVASGVPSAVALRGQIPVDDYPAIQSKSDRIWFYLRRRFALSDLTPAPTVQFQPFDLAAQSPDWSAWQKDWIRTHPTIWRDWSAMQPARSAADTSAEWIDSHIDSVFPFPKNFIAFHYDGTNQIQIDPLRGFRDSMQVFVDGERRDRNGRGFYSLGHEMLHYALELRGVSQKKLHHCLMLYTDDDSGDAPAVTSALMPALMPALMEEVANHLVDEHIIAPVARLRGLRTEQSLRPCARLSDDELAQVASIRERLAVSVTVTAPAAGQSHGVGD